MTDLPALLASAADRARSQTTTDRAVRAAWSHLHTDRPLMRPAFDAWCRAEGFTSHPSGLGGVLRRRYSTPAEVAASLTRAADRSQEGHTDRG